MPDTVTYTNPDAPSVSRKLSLVSMVLALVALTFALFQRAVGNASTWTAVALPLLLVLNASVMFFGVAKKSPRATKVYWLISSAFAIVVLVSLFSRLVR
jgi:hypothetical protein